MPVLTDVGLLVTPEAGAPQGTFRTLEHAALGWREGTICWVGPQADVPADLAVGERYSAAGALVVPGLVDCHTHLAFAGWRAEEFEQRALGRTYLEIAHAGGGIQRTVALTRAASEEELVARCESHLREVASLGITTIECKSGYGLSLESELKLLRVYQRLARSQSLRIVPTLLGAHTVPGDYRECRGDYLEMLCTELVPEAARQGLARFCDVFVEESAFSVDEARRVFAVAMDNGLVPKLHADQLSDGGGAALAAEVRAASADHLEHVSPDGIARLAGSGVVAVSLPLASLYLRQPPMPARDLLRAGVPVAVATDFNPGTAPSVHLPLAMTLACTQQGMTPREALAAATTVAAGALRLDRQIGRLEPGFAADFALIDSPDIEHWLYHFRPNACVGTWVGGRRIH